MLNMKTTLKLVAIAGMGLLAAPALAEIKPVFHVGYEFGGDELVKITYVGGETSTINAGDGLLLAGGIGYPITPEVSVLGTVGWKYQSTRQAANGSADFTRFPLDALVQYTEGKLRAAGGITYHLSPKVDTSGVLSSFGAVNFEDAMGAVAQLDYTSAIGLVLGVRYTSLSYTERVSQTTVSADSFGIYMTNRF